MSELFSEISEAYVILCVNGVFKQEKLYQRDKRVYAGWGSGFIGLSSGNGTTKKGVAVLDIVQIDKRYTFGKDALGRMTMVRDEYNNVGRAA